ncbi:MAG: beta-propeller fold lactonase family protein [Acidiferrobacter sp.]
MGTKTRFIMVSLVCALLTACGHTGGGANSSTSSGAASPSPSPSSSTAAQSGVSAQTTLLLTPAGTHSLEVYVRDPETKALVDRGYVPTGLGPVAVAATSTPQGAYVYVANNTAGTVSAYSWNPITHMLVSLPGSPVTVGGAPTALVVVGSTLYVGDTGANTIAALAIGSNGALTPLTLSSVAYATMALLSGPDTLYQLSAYGIAAFTSGANGSLTLPGTQVSVNGIIAGTISGDNLYVVTSADALSVYTLTDLSAPPTTVSLSGLTPTGVTVTPGTPGMVAVSGNTSSGAAVSYFALPLGTSTSPQATLATKGSAGGITSSPGGRYVFVTNPARGDLLAYTVPTSQTAVTLSAILRTRPTPGAPLSLAVTVNLTPPSLYVVNQGASVIAAYPAASDGTLGTPIATTTCASCTSSVNQGPGAAMLAPSGQFLYASDWEDGVSTFGIEANGALAPPTSTPAGTNPMGVAVDPSNRYLYVANSCYINNTQTNCPGTISSYTIQDGALTAMSSSPTAVNGNSYPMLLAVDPTGRFLYVSEFASNLIGAFSIDSDTGTLTSLSAAATNTGPWALVIGPSGRHLYVSNNGSDTVSIYTIDETNGALTPASPNLLTITGNSLQPLGLVMGPNGRRLYVATQSGTLDVFTRSSPTSAPTSWSGPISISGTFPNAYGLAISSNGQALYVVDDCTSPNYTDGAIQALAIPAFSATSASAYPVLGTYQTNTCSVQAVPAGGLN